MTYKMLLIKSDSTTEFIESDTRPAFSEMQKLVGGYIERTFCEYTVDLEPYVMLVNEDGIGMDLPVNELASRYALTTIVGDALILQNFDLE